MGSPVFEPACTDKVGKHAYAGLTGLGCWL